MTSKDRQIMIVAGEASGDLHAAKLVNALRQGDPAVNYRFFGSAGPRMREAEVEPIIRADDLSIVGLLEIGRSLPMFLRARNQLLAAARERMPDAVVLVDFPDFNLKLARSLKKLGLTVVYYISPQVWAWRKYRVSSIRKYVDLLITILPFEKEWFVEQGIHHVEYVGSPLAREVFPKESRADFRLQHGIQADQIVVALLPGSRHKEISRILPIMLESAIEISRSEPEIVFFIAAATETAETQIHSQLASHPLEEVKNRIKVINGETYDVLNAADAAVVTSGTATMECGIIGTPLVIVYQTSGLNYTLLRPLISVEHYGLINLVAGERIAEELIQHDFTPRSVAAEVRRLLDPKVNDEKRKKLREATEKLGHGGASRRAAELISALVSDQGRS